MRRLYIMLLAVLLPLMELAAQQEVAQEDTTKQKPFFNALDYSLQKRYRARKYPFKNERFMDNTYVSVQMGMEDYLHRPGADMGVGKNLSVSFGKLWTEAHSFRATIDGGWSYASKADDTFLRLGVKLSHLFNITSYMAGYDPSRVFEVSTVAGIGYNYSTRKEGDNFHVGEIHLGAQLKLHLFPQADFFLEPLLTFYSDGIDHYTRTNWHKYDLGYGARLGFIYRLSNPLPAHLRKEKGQESDRPATFVSAQGGVQYQYSDLVREMGITNTFGPHAAVSAGKWFTPFLAMRVSAFFGQDTWNSYDTVNEEETFMTIHYLTTRYMGVRTEAMCNVLGFFNDMEWTRHWAFSVLAGAELGGMIKKDISQEIKQAYIGFTGGLQVKYNINHRWGVFVEPRMSLVPYSYMPKGENGAILMDRQNYSDNIYSLNLGVEFAL